MLIFLINRFLDSICSLLFTSNIGTMKNNFLNKLSIKFCATYNFIDTITQIHSIIHSLTIYICYYHA